MINNDMRLDPLLRVGKVIAVEGRTITIEVGKNRNLSDLLIDGEIVRNIAVSSYIEIRKGFLSMIGRVEGEVIEERFQAGTAISYDEMDKNLRHLNVALIGYIAVDGRFEAGTRELPLIGNEAFVLSREKFLIVHNLLDNSGLYISVAKTEGDFDLSFPVDGLFTGHIAIFGNTGSGKSNTLAQLYCALVRALRERNCRDFKNNTRFVLFDFNGEFAGDGPNGIITTDKKVYNLSTHGDGGDRISIPESELLSIEILSILSDATDKTQKPFLKRALALYDKMFRKESVAVHTILKRQVRQILTMSDKTRAHLLLDYLEQILVEGCPDLDGGQLRDDITWHNGVNEFYIKRTNGQSEIYLGRYPDFVQNTKIYQSIDRYRDASDVMDNLIVALYVKLIDDVLDNRALNDHIAPVINRLRSRKIEISRIFDSSCLQSDFWVQNNFNVINLLNVNLEMKKTVPLLLCKTLYDEHKRYRGERSLSIIIDEAHTILSHQSTREAESWKDYRLETFEEIVKEGRKFGVFLTISSQRPNDISQTISSQAHNYFIHRLVNQKDLDTISSAVSYIDKIAEESIPLLPTGTCIFSGIAGKRPMKIQIKELPDLQKPRSQTLLLSELVPTEEYTRNRAEV